MYIAKYVYYTNITLLKALQKYYDESKNKNYAITKHTKVNYKIM